MTEESQPRSIRLMGYVLALAMGLAGCYLLATAGSPRPASRGVSPVEWAVFLVAPQACLVWIAIDTKRDLKRLGARRVAYLLLGLVSVPSLLTPTSAYLLNYRSWLPMAMVLPAAIVYFVPSLAVALSGGPLPVEGLTRDVRKVAKRYRKMAGANELTGADEAWLTEQSRRLDRWRGPGTEELVDLYQEDLRDVVDGKDPEHFQQRQAGRAARINELTAAQRDRGSK